MERARQAGASVLLILLIMVLILVGMTAAYTLSRVGTGGNDRDDTNKRLATAAAALESFAAVSGYLPCPADPMLTTGLADPKSTKECNHSDDGTLPWATLGLLSEAGLDAWGRKISYRVYTGPTTGPNKFKGSLTQPRGVDMVECDITDEFPAVDPDGLCLHDDDIYKRSTTRDSFLAGKGLMLTDFGVPHPDTAYVLISHGATGLGAWTIAGTQMDLPTGDERDNTQNTKFWIEAFSDPDTSFKGNKHFDDQVVYMTLSELIKRIGRDAREWPEPGQVVLNKSNIEATGAVIDPATGNTGTATINFTNAQVVVSGFSGSGSGTATNVSYDANAGGGGTGGIGIVSGDSLMSSGQSEWLHVDFGTAKRKFGVTFANFGTFTSAGTTYIEKVQLRFYDGATLVSSTVLAGCREQNLGPASFSDVTPAGPFTAVDIVPIAASGTPSGVSDSALLVSEVNGCSNSSLACKTLLSSVANMCP